MSWPNDGQPTILCSMRKPDNVFLLEEDDHPNWRMVLHKEAQAKVWRWRGPCHHSSTRNACTNTGFGGSDWVVDFPCHYGKRAIEEMNGLYGDLARCKGQPQKGNWDVCVRGKHPHLECQHVHTWECTQHRCYLTFGESLSLGIHFEGGRRNYELYATLH